MKVLILNEYNDKTPFIKELAENLVDRDFEIYILDLKQHRLVTYSQNEPKPSIESTTGNILIKKLIRFRAINILFKLIYYNWIYELPEYTHVSYHYVGSIYLFFHGKFSRSGKIKSSAVLWGSDFYRANAFDTALKRRLYQKVDFIGIGNPIMKEHFLKQNPEVESKVRRVVFGIDKLTKIQQLLSTCSRSELMKKWDVPERKIIITIGYNGRRLQQHLEVLSSLEKALEKLEDTAHILIPYGNLGTDQYKRELTHKLEEMSLDYTIIDWFSSDQEVAEYRIISDVAINAQTTDAMSASIQEHLYAGSVVLTGSWLPYDYFRNLGLVFSSFEWSTVSEKFIAIVESLKRQKEAVQGNKEIIWSHSAWPATIKDWVNLYK